MDQRPHMHHLSELRFLVVDDFATMRRIVSGLLHEIGATHISEAENGRHALRILAGGHIDFILTDWNMPEMNGLELLKAVRATDALKDLPVLMVTSESLTDNIVQAAKAGASGYVVKPFTAKILQDKVAAIWAKHKVAHP